MSKIHVSLLALAAAIAFTATASAADLPASASAGNLYVFGVGGISMPRNVDANQQGVDPDEKSVLIGVDNGYSFSGGMGYAMGNDLKLEAEVGYMKFDTSTITLPDYSGGSINDDAPGSVGTTYGMASAWYSLDTGSIRPFVGGGVGIIDVNINSGPYFGDKSVDDSDTAFAWQVGAGVEVDLASNVQLVGRYRYLSSSDFDVADSDGTTIKASLDSHIVDAGLRFNF